jgi:hypothetical protein
MVIYDVGRRTNNELILLSVTSDDKKVLLHGLKNGVQAQILSTNQTWESVTFSQLKLTEGIMESLAKNCSWKFVHFENCENMTPSIMSILVSNVHWKNVFLGSTKLSDEVCEILILGKWDMIDLYNTSLNDRKIEILLKNCSWKYVNLCGNFDISLKCLAVDVENHVEIEKKWFRVYSYHGKGIDNYVFLNGYNLDEHKKTPM